MTAKMAEIIPMVGLYKDEHYEPMLSILYGKWASLTNTAIVYVRLWSLDDTKSYADFEKSLSRSIDMVYKDKPADMKVIIGFEIQGGDLATDWDHYFDTDRWEWYKKLTKFAQKKTKNREVVWVHESAATNVLYRGGPIDESAVTNAHKIIGGMDIWHDMPVPRSYQSSVWLSTANAAQPKSGPRWKWIAANPGTFDSAKSPSGLPHAQWKEHITTVGPPNYMERCFVSSNGLWMGDKWDCFDVWAQSTPASRNLKKFLEKKHTNPVVLYPGHNQFGAVADTMIGWYAR